MRICHSGRSEVGFLLGLFCHKDSSHNHPTQNEKSKTKSSLSGIGAEVARARRGLVAEGRWGLTVQCKLEGQRCP